MIRTLKHLLVKFSTLVFLVPGILFGSGVSPSETLASYDFGFGSPKPSVAAHVSAGDAQWFGLEGGFSAQNNTAYVTTDQTSASFDSERYLEFYISADEGYVLKPSAFSFKLGGSRLIEGPDFTVSAVLRANLDNKNLKFTPGGFSNASHTFNETTPTFTEYTTDLSSQKYQQLKSLTFRIYFSSSAATNQVHLRIDSAKLEGTVVPGKEHTIPISGNKSMEELDVSLNRPDLILTPAPLFTDHAVLQQGKPLPVWGVARPNTKVSVRFGGQVVETQSDDNGFWRTSLAPLQANSIGQDFVLESAARKIILNDVVVGEVWLCSGQSNMEWPLKGDPNEKTIVRESNFPQIRQFKVKNVSVEEPAWEADGSWVVCSPETAGAFTAVGYYFARDLQPKLGVPIGLINSSWGATGIDAWMSADALESFPAVAKRWERILEELPKKQVAYEKARAEYKRKAAEAKASGADFDWRNYPKPPPGPGTREAPSGIFNGMIAPLIPFPIAGILWYQGESNSGSAGSYEAKFPVFIEDWRNRWDARTMPFYFVQLPNYQFERDHSGTKWAEFRAAQMKALSLPETGAAIVIDGKTPVGHPPDKTDVGLRLARLAEIRHYQIASGDASGPLLESAKRRGPEVELSFSEASSGLEVNGDKLLGFELSNAQGEFFEADAVIDGDKVIVSCEKVSLPKEVRYAWHNNPQASLYNGNDLPASPFITEVE